MKRFFALVVALLAVLPLNAQRRDSVYTASEQFKPVKLIAPVSLMGVGAICTLTPWLRNNVDVPIQNGVQSWAAGRYWSGDDWIQYAPLAGYVVAGLAGAGKHGRWEQMLTGATAFGLMMIGTHTIKLISNRQRPNEKGRSFPSGHTATVFMGAELVRLEYGPWWGLAAYTVAVTTGFFRIWNNWHWTSDVLAGAGLGILCANAAYWLLPLERKLFRLDSRLSVLPAVLPAPTGTSVGVSMSFAL
ncbi:MAG: phosphatase PAP2 family protein [Bacteroidales bacterium]|nr:phosphatase PAP2 family protein [Bacteroidales bacterium]